MAEMRVLLAEIHKQSVGCHPGDMVGAKVDLIQQLASVATENGGVNRAKKENTSNWREIKG